MEKEIVEIKKEDIEVKEVKPQEVEATKNIEVPIVEKTEKVEGQGKGLSIASMVLGIVSVALVYSVVISLVCAILAVIFGLKGKERDGKGMAKAGFILGIISLSIIGAIFITAIMFMGLAFFIAIV